MYLNWKEPLSSVSYAWALGAFADHCGVWINHPDAIRKLPISHVNYMLLGQLV